MLIIPVINRKSVPAFVVWGGDMLKFYVEDLALFQA